MLNWRSQTSLLLAIGLLVFLSSGCGDLDTEISSLTVSPTSSTVGINQSRVFTAVGKNSLGFVVDIDPIWSVSGNIGTISSSGLFIAGATAGSGTVTASYGDSSASATVTVTENGWLTGQVSSSLGLAVGIRVFLQQSPTLQDFTDSSGLYSISNIPPGTYWAVTGATDTFQSSSAEVTVDPGETATWDFFVQLQPGVPDVPTTTLPTF
jgi:hypothetical protein